MDMRPTIVRFDTSLAELPPGSALVRRPRKAWWPRAAGFFRDFEDRILVYDCFEYIDGRILLVGPPPLNLEGALSRACFSAVPSGTALKAEIFPSRSTTIIGLSGAPAGTQSLRISLSGLDIELRVQRDSAPDFEGRRLLFTINKNNRLEWIRTWAQWHASQHGTDAVILIDNGSTDYAIDDIEATLSGVDGLKLVSVLSMPYKFGPLDHWVPTHHFWPRFLQISATSIILRRFGMRAAGVINCDIDELMWSGGRSVYDLAGERPLGTLRVPGRWIEAAYEGNAPANHFGFRYRKKGIRSRLSPPKCVLVPSREWVRDLRVHPYLHRIHGAPAGHRIFARDAMFWHFRGINTNWKEPRTEDTNPTSALEIDQDWLGALEVAKSRSVDLLSFQGQ